MRERDDSRSSTAFHIWRSISGSDVSRATSVMRGENGCKSQLSESSLLNTEASSPATVPVDSLDCNLFATGWASKVAIRLEMASLRAELSKYMSQYMSLEGEEVPTVWFLLRLSRRPCRRVGLYGDRLQRLPNSTYARPKRCFRNGIEFIFRQLRHFGCVLIDQVGRRWLRWDVI